MSALYPSEEAMFEALHAAKKFARGERFAWPGGYPLILVMSDGETLCCKCAKSEWRSIVYSTIRGEHDGWAVMGVDAYWEGPPERCAHCDAETESAYGDPDAATDPA